MDDYQDLLVPTSGRPFIDVQSLPGIGLKPLNTVKNPAVWSTILRIERGASLPPRLHSGFCEMLVVSGCGKYISGTAISKGDYLREHSGEYEAILAEETLELFVSHHGICTVMPADPAQQVTIGQDRIKELLAETVQNDEGFG